MPPQQPNQPNFDFIMNSQQPSAKKSLLPTGNSTGQRIAIVAIIVGVLVAFLVLMMIILGGGGDNKQNLLTVAQQQTEIARVTALATESSDQSLKNFVMNTQLGVTSDKQSLLNALGENGIKFKDKDLALGQNPDTDQALETAKAAANFDAVIRDTLTELLKDYQASLETAFNQSGNETIKNSLSSAYENAAALLKQVEPSTKA